MALLREHLRGFSFDRRGFEYRVGQYCDGLLSAQCSRLKTAPLPIPPLHPFRVRLPSQERSREGEFYRVGARAIRDGKVASLILNGGMATRFGGGAKGVMAIHPRYEMSFLQVKLAQLRAQARNLGGAIPAVVMNSFATRADSMAHLERVDWCGLPLADRYTFNQSIVPRLSAEGEVLVQAPMAAGWADNLVYSAPGHGDTLASLRASGLLELLKRRGVEHLVVSNVDNVGASVSPELVGAHLQGVAQGREMSIEGVPRRAGEKGGCLAMGPQGPAIFEGFRLPEACSLDDYPDFNTNTIWFSLESLRKEIPLSWFPVHRSINTPTHPEGLGVVQFEQLIGEASEYVPSQLISVSRDERFFPVKRRSDLEVHAVKILDAIHRWCELPVSPQPTTASL